jgi:hypothetical protein
MAQIIEVPAGLAEEAGRTSSNVETCQLSGLDDAGERVGGMLKYYYRQAA